jgi:hypothetical protein
VIRSLALAALALPLLAAADDRFDALRTRAERVDSLGSLLERYLGSCRDPFTRADCERNVGAARRSIQGKVLWARVSDGASEIVRARAEGGRFRIDVTPFIDGGGFALTHGSPLRQDGDGRPVIGLVVLQGALPPGVPDLDFFSPFRTGRVEMEVVFEVQGAWKMKRRDGGLYEGVRARFLALRLVDPRTGAEIASRVL